MSHTVREHDGMKVLVVSDMNRRYDEDGKLTSSKDMEGLEIVHAAEIAKYYGVPLRSIGKGDNEVPGVWAMVHTNEFGQRVAYNSEETKRGDRHIRQWKVTEKDSAGNALQTKEAIINTQRHFKPSGVLETMPLVDETDDGMYVRLSDVLEFAEAQGWKKGGGRPGAQPTAAHVEDTNAKLDKLAEIVTGLATIVAQQVVAAPPPAPHVTPVPPAKK